MMKTGRQRALAGIGLGAVAGALAFVLACSPVADKSTEQPVTGAAATTTAAATSPAAATGMVTPTPEERAAAASTVVFGQLPDVTTAATATGIDPAQEGEAYVAGEVLVTLFKGTTVEQLNELVQGAASLEKREIEPSDLLSCKEENGVLVDSADMDPVVLLHVAQGANVAQAAAEVSSSPVVQSASANSILRLQTQQGSEGLRDRLGTTKLVTASTNVNDPSASSQWHLEATRLPEAWDLTRCDGSDGVEVGDDNVAVAIIDTGILATHEDLTGNIIATYDASKGTETISDINGHGTHVAGISSASTNNEIGVAGAAYNANIVAIKFFADNGAATDAGIRRTFSYLANNMDRLNIRVANFSIGGGNDDIFTDEDWSSDYICSCITNLRDRENGLLFVAAAGNYLSAQYDSSGTMISPEYAPPYNEYPGDYDDCFSVMNLQRNWWGSGYTRASGSNYNVEGVTAESKNQTKDIAVPGTSIYSTYFNSDSSYVSQSGTSMASPLAAGISALCFAEDPTLTPDDVQNLIQNTANTEIVGQTEWSREYGYGMIDAYAAVSHIMSNVNVAAIPDQEYTGDAVEPALTLTNHDGTELVAGTDYTVTFTDNVDAGTATATITGAGSYVGSATVTFTIANELFTAQDVTVTYDGQPHTPVVTPSEAGVSIMYSADGGSTYTLSESPTRVATGTTTIYFQATLGDQVAHGSATVTVAKAPLTVTSVTASNKTYDGTTTATATGFAFSGAVGDEQPTVTATGVAFEDENAGADKTVTATGIALTDDAVNGNYELASTTTTGTASINRKILSLGFEVQDQEYNGSNSAGYADRYFSGFIRGKVPSVDFTSAEFPSYHAGTYTLTITATLGDTGNSLNYAFLDSGGNEVTSVDVSTTASITPRPITLESESLEKTYDGTALTSEEDDEWNSQRYARTVGITSNKGLALSFESIYFRKTNESQTTVGSCSNTFEYKAGPTTEINDYSITVEYGTLTVTPATLTPSITNADKVYDGTTQANGSITLEGAVAGETPVATASAMAFDSAAAGDGKTVTATGVALTDTAVNGNYELASTTARGTASITPAPLTVASVTATDKTYDGTTSATVTDVTLAGAVEGELPTATASGADFDTKDAGAGKTVTATGFALDAANPVNANYSIASTAATTTASVLPRHVTLTSASASKTYDGKPLTAHNVSVGGSGWAAGEGATYAFTGSQTAVGSSANAFTYTLTAATSADDYAITTATGTLTVNEAPNPTPTPQSQVMYRLYNPNSGEHFYTANKGERDTLTRVGWTYEGHGWNAPTTGSPVYRLYNANAGDHHYTVSKGERDALVATGWAYEGVGWYSGGTTKLWRQYNPNAQAGSHNYTPNTAERDALVAVGWHDEGVAWYGL